MRMAGIPPIKGNGYLYRLPDAQDRSTYTFRVAAMTEEYEIGPAAEVTMAIPKKEMPTPLETASAEPTP